MNFNRGGTLALAGAGGGPAGVVDFGSVSTVDVLDDCTIAIMPVGGVGSDVADGQSDCVPSVPRNHHVQIVAAQAVKGFGSAGIGMTDATNILIAYEMLDDGGIETLDQADTATVFSVDSTPVDAQQGGFVGFAVNGDGANVAVAGMVDMHHGSTVAMQRLATGGTDLADAEPGDTGDVLGSVTVA